MDVTSMLNNSASLVTTEEKKHPENPKIQTRNRTPWDAGGYSLPIMSHQITQSSLPDSHRAEDMHTSREQRSQDMFNTNDGNSRLQIQENNMFDTISNNKEEFPGQENVTDDTRYRRDSQQIGRHQLSDSRSSLSSFASSLSLNSASHSRYSSTSTVSGFQPLGTIADESAADLKNQNATFSQSLKSPVSQSPTTPHPRSHSVTTATEPLSTLALIAERRSQEDLSTDAAEFERLKKQRGFAGTTKAKGIMLGYDFRSASPSDGLLIKRTSQQNLHETSPKDRKRRLYDPIQNLIHGAEHENDARSHKRTSSAPGNIRLLKEEPIVFEASNLQSAESLAEPVPHNSNELDQKSPLTSSFGLNMDRLIEPQTIPEPTCMYIKDCDTNSTPRKAISHLLGRNKMCTRLIPAHIWVQYCRKHYQRARYRNMSGWPPLQCELVQKQIERLHNWSDENVARKSGAVVKDWTLALRKREQTRRDRLGKGVHKKSDSVDTKDDSDAEVEDISPTRGDRNDNPPQAVPEWLFDMVGSGYSGSEISAIFEKIHRAILDKELPNMPDIEILPNIIIDREAPKETKGYVKRKPASHQRSRSLGGAALRGSEIWNSAIRSGSQPVWDPAPMYGNNSMSPSVKRKRFDEIEEEPGYTQSVQNSQRIRPAHQDLARRQAGVPRAYSAWNDPMIHQPSQQTQQHQQYQQMQFFHQQQNQRTNQSYMDDIHARNNQYQQHLHQHNTYNQHNGANMYPSPIMAPQPTRPYMPTAQQLDNEASLANRRGVMHQRARSDVSFLQRRDDMQSYNSNMMIAMPQQQQQQPQHNSQYNHGQFQLHQQQVNHYGQQQHMHQQMPYHQQGMQHQQSSLPRMEGQEMRPQQFIDPNAHTWGVSEAVFRR